MDEITLAEIADNARRIHTEGKFLADWAESVEVFVEDMLEIVEASYRAGFEEAVQVMAQALDSIGE